MNIKDLQSAVDDFNVAIGSMSSQVECWGNFAGSTLQGGDQIAASIRSKIFTVPSPATRHAVVDTAMKSNADAGVILAIGINYGQQAMGNSTNTAMRSGLSALNAFFGSPPLIPADYHLVAWNVFPYLTRCEWLDLKLNSLEEALVLRFFGYSNWQGLTLNLVDRVKPFVVVFHGVQSVVPHFGMQIVDSIRPNSSDEFPRVVFCGNLARNGQGVRRARTTVEIRPPLRRPFNRHVHDE